MFELLKRSYKTDLKITLNRLLYAISIPTNQKENNQQQQKRK